MFGFLGDIDSVKQAAEVNNTGKKEDPKGSVDDLLPGFGSLWSVAKAVQSAVQQTAGEVVRSVQETDWKSEITAFTHEVEAEAHKAVEVVQHLPAQLQTRVSESGEDEAAAHGGHSPSSTAVPPFGVVGSSLANFGKQLISGTKEVIDTVTDMVEGEIATASREVPRFAAGGKSSSGSSDAATRLASRQRLATRYSRFEAEVAAMQRDSATYVDEPEDAEDFAAWRSSSFSMSSVQPEIDKILSGNAFMSELQSRLVPLLVEKEEFWARYFYRLHKLQQKEEQRQQLAARAKQLDDQEDLGGWDDEESPHAAATTHQQQVQQQQQQSEPALAANEAAAQPEAHERSAGSSSRSEAGGVDHSPKAAGTAAASSDQVLKAEQQPQSAATPPSTESSTSSSREQSEPTSTSAAFPAAPATAAAAAAAVVSRKVSADDSSFPSTPVQVGSETSDAAPATDTVSEGSSAMAAAPGQGPAAPWTMVAPGPTAAATTTAAGVTQQPSLPASPAAAGTAAAVSQQSVSIKQGQQQEAAGAISSSGSDAVGHSSPAPDAVAAKAAAAPAAAAAADDDEDDDWGDDADNAVAAVAAGTKGGGATATAAADADDDWGNWE